MQYISVRIKESDFRAGVIVIQKYATKNSGARKFQWNLRQLSVFTFQIWWGNAIGYVNKWVNFMFFILLSFLKVCLYVRYYNSSFCLISIFHLQCIRKFLRNVKTISDVIHSDFVKVYLNFYWLNILFKYKIIYTAYALSEIF